jgi:hypothetical protein
LVTRYRVDRATCIRWRRLPSSHLQQHHRYAHTPGVKSASILASSKTMVKETADPPANKSLYGFTPRDAIISRERACRRKKRLSSIHRAKTNEHTNKVIQSTSSVLGAYAAYVHALGGQYTAFPTRDFAKRAYSSLSPETPTPAIHRYLSIIIRQRHLLPCIGPA